MADGHRATAFRCEKPLHGNRRPRTPAAGSAAAGPGADWLLVHDPRDRQPRRSALQIVDRLLSNLRAADGDAL